MVCFANIIALDLKPFRNAELRAINATLTSPERSSQCQTMG